MTSIRELAVSENSISRTRGNDDTTTMPIWMSTKVVPTGTCCIAADEYNAART